LGSHEGVWEEASLASVLGTVFGGLLEGAAIDGRAGLAILEDGSFQRGRPPEN